MKARLVLAALLAGGLLVSVSGAQAATPVMDGRKVKVLTKTAAGGVQANPTNDEITCEEPKCMTLQFVYAPAKGIKGGLLFTASWTNPLTDLDLYVVEVDTKKRIETRVGVCGGAPSNKEVVYLAPSELRPGKQYRMVVSMFLSLNETVTGKVEINVPNTIPATAPKEVDAQHKVNCTL